MKNTGIALSSNTDGLEINVVKDSLGKITGGLTIMDITAQNQAVILQSHPGEIKEVPSVGVGISDMLLDNNTLAWERLIRQQLETEGMRIKKLEIAETYIDIDAEYK